MLLTGIDQFFTLNSILTDELQIGTLLLILCFSTLYGFGYAFLYKFFKKKQGFSIDLPLAVILMPIGVAAIVLLSRTIGIQSTAARTTLGFSFAGILCITRFRSTQKDATDLIFIMLSIISGFLCGFGYMLYSILVVVLSAIIIVIVYFTKFNVPSIKEMTLKIVVPESLNFDNLFDDVLDEYCSVWNMKSIKSADFGTMFELSYVVTCKDLNKQKEFIDKLRERNGNLTISLSVRRFNSMIQQ